MRLYLSSLLFAICLYSSCAPSPYYQNNQNIAQNKWDYKKPLTFSINIDDTSIFYNTQFIIRHTVNYPFSNLWLNIQVKGPGDKEYQTTQVDFPMASPQGEWLGLNMGELYEQRRLIVLNHNEIPITNELYALSTSSIPNLFRKKGSYEIKIYQNMRQDILPDILSIGMRIEKSTLRSKNLQSTAPQKPTNKNSPIS